VSLRSPLGRVLGSGSANDGTEHWWAQRVTAVALLILGLWFLYSLLQLDGFAHATVSAWIGRPFTGVMMLLLCLTLAWHSYLGVQVVLEDYVHGPLIKVVSLLLSRFAHAFLAIAAVLAILKVSLGGSV
jgi:succinate dehydrogenase / fumarate reductase membrane anchor subunit